MGAHCSNANVSVLESTHTKRVSCQLFNREKRESEKGCALFAQRHSSGSKYR